MWSVVIANKDGVYKEFPEELLDDIDDIDLKVLMM
jgi:hypothetical protein